MGLRAAVLAAVGFGMRRNILKTAAVTGRYPAAIATDGIVHPSASLSPLDVLP
ncbi:hypothetical protein QQM39_44210 [Streptomyces sp. DT2A-34]|uniref:hypothetical protein n=1 Tax=Streptomyces sp. DT2A-34 TaxID=3051182 RepID=UPI00265BC4E3|nr:hypothetical protein [Streptomyces sp. DT2A-34]MDO0917547.1 hypothetical protein [Streptomyces sp. DT2A-34]